jgi:oligosaccharide repeat unit polymerase
MRARSRSSSNEERSSSSSAAAVAEPVALPPRLRFIELVLSSAVVGIALAAYATSNLSQLSLLIRVALVVSLLLFAYELRLALLTGTLGKCLLIGACIAFFWVQAASMANGPTPFMPQNLRGPQPMSFGVVRLAFVYVAVFQALLLVGYSIRLSTRRLAARAAARVDRPVAARWVPYVLASGAGLSVLAAASFNSSNAFNTLLEARTSTKSLDLVSANYGLNVLYIIGVFGVALLVVRTILEPKSRRPLHLVATALLAVPVFLNSARHVSFYVGLAALAAVLVQIRSGRRSRAGRSSGRARRTAVFVGVALLLVAQVQFVLRTVGFDQLDVISPSRLVQTNVTDQFGALLFAVSYVPHEHGYFVEPFEPNFVTFWVPSQLWPNKPEIRTYRFFDDTYTAGRHGSNQTPTIIGQYHMSFGAPGVAIAALWLGFLARAADGVLLRIRRTKQTAAIAAVGFFYAFLLSSFRLYAPYYFAFFVISFFCMLALTSRKKAVESSSDEVPASPPLGSKLRIAEG